MKKTQSNIARLLRQLVFVPLWQARWLDDAAKSALKAAIGDAERGHRGEIYLIIENRLPLMTAYHQDSRARALELFALHGVWDTQYNTGVLVYVNLCEHRLEIIADRGIDHLASDAWQPLALQTSAQMYAGAPLDALTTLLGQIGELMRTHFAASDDMGNELVDAVVHL